MQAWIANKKWETVEDVIGSYRSLEGKFGAPPNELVHLKPADDTDAWHGPDGIYAKLGRPGEPTDYKAPENLPLIEGEQDLTGEFAKTAHEIGLSQTQFEKIVDWFATGRASRVEAYQADVSRKVQEGLDAVKAAWGENWDGNLAIARNGMAALGMDREMAAALEPVIGTDKLMMKMLEIGRRLGDHNAGAHGGSQSQEYLTRSEAEARIEVLQADQEFMDAWVNPSNPRHADAKRQMDALYSLAYPGEKR